MPTRVRPLTMALLVALTMLMVACGAPVSPPPAESARPTASAAVQPQPDGPEANLPTLEPVNQGRPTMPEGIVDGLFPATVHAVTEIVLEDPPGRVVSPPVFGGLEVASAVSAQPENPLTGGPLNPQQVSINDGALLNGVPGEMIVIATGDRSANPHVRCLVFAVSEATDPASYEGNLKTSAIFAMVSNHTAPDTRSDYGTHYRDRCLNDG